MTTDAAPSGHSGLTGRGALGFLLVNGAVLLAGIMVILGFVFVSASLDPAASRQSVTEAFDSGVLTADTYRTIEVVPGFIVAESDGFSSCVMYGQMLSPSENVFGTRLWTEDGQSCAGLIDALHGGESAQYPWYRYWHGGSAIAKVLLTVMSVHAAQILLTALLALLVTVLFVRTRRFSKTLSVGLLVTLVLTSDTLWQGLSLIHGISTSVGLTGVIAAQIAFERGWRFRWAVVALGGFAYAVTAQMLVPMAFAVLAGVMAMLPVLRPGPVVTSRRVAVGFLASATWVGGYVLGLGSRYVWVATFGPGLDELRAEISTTAGGFASDTLISPFHGVLGLLMKTWFQQGWMQVGLLVAFLVMGWSLGRGASRHLLEWPVLVSLAPLTFAVAWLGAWGYHTNHTFVHFLLAIMLFAVMFSIEVARRIGQDHELVVAEPAA